MFSEPFFDKPHTWKWAIPAAIFILLIPVTGKMFASTNAETQYWSILPCGVGGLMLAMAMVNLWKLITTHNAEMFSEHQSALSITPLVLLSKSMQTMHPEAVRVLNRFGVRTSWQVRVDPLIGTRDWVLADTNVHLGFIEHVLSRSGKAFYPKNRFSQGSKKWDPDGIVEDREQYDEFEIWMFSRLMVTRSHGEFKPAEFIPPWTPGLILETMGLTGEQDLYRPDENGKPVAEISGQQPAAPLSSKTTSPQMAGERRNLGGREDVKPLTEEELESIRVEMVRNASQYSS